MVLKNKLAAKKHVVEDVHGLEGEGLTLENNLYDIRLD